MARLGERETLTSPGVRVLGLDSRGMRGVVTLLKLEELEKMSGAKTHQMFDIVVGTSTGALIASMMGISCMGRGWRCTGRWGGRYLRGVW